MGLFGSIGKAIGGVAKTVTKPLAGVAKVVAKPVSAVVNPLANAAKKAAKSAVKGTPLEDAVNKMTSVNLKNPLAAAKTLIVENFKGAANLGKSLVAAKIGGAVQGALKGTPLEGTSVQTAIQGEISSVTNKLTGMDVLKAGAKSTRVAGGGDIKADGAIKGSSPFGMKLGKATDPSWVSFASQPETMGGVFGGNHS